VDLLVDTDVFVDHLRGAHRFRLGDHHVSYSVITRCELFAGHAVEEGRVARLLAPFQELGVDRVVAERAGRLRRARTIRVPDALIAATALEHGLTLLTRNQRDFGTVPGLAVRTPR
jgi:predicted nucleic acid-binding protein